MQASHVEEQLIGLMKSVFEIEGADRNTRVSLADGIVMLEDIGVDVSLNDLTEFLYDESNCDDVHYEDGLEIEEFKAFLQWAGSNLTTSTGIIDYCKTRGAKIEILTSAAKITGSNGVMVPRMQCFHKQAWSPKAGDWKNVMRALWNMGLRLDVKDSAQSEWCKWCSKELGFRTPEDIASCRSNHFSCCQHESNSWSRKL